MRNTCWDHMLRGQVIRANRTPVPTTTAHLQPRMTDHGLIHGPYLEEELKLGVLQKLDQSGEPSRACVAPWGMYGRGGKEIPVRVQANRHHYARLLCLPAPGTYVPSFSMPGTYHCLVRQLPT